uniref:Olfactory receptor n=1 Tax=Bombyx mori TaxID=7091 RepID=C4B7V9_BOMMO|nr:olfactory receptor [Bombyx mori]
MHTLALVFALLYPSNCNIIKRAIGITLIIALSGGQLFWCMTYTFNVCVLILNYSGFDGSFCIASIRLCMKLKLVVYKVQKAFAESKSVSELKHQLNDAIKDNLDALKFHEQIQNVFFIALVGRRAYGPPDGEWLPSPMDFSNTRGRTKPLSTVYEPWLFLIFLLTFLII